jgi:hypothetical protein
LQPDLANINENTTDPLCKCKYPENQTNHFLKRAQRSGPAILVLQHPRPAAAIVNRAARREKAGAPTRDVLGPARPDSPGGPVAPDTATHTSPRPNETVGPMRLQSCAHMPRRQAMPRPPNSPPVRRPKLSACTAAGRRLRVTPPAPDTRTPAPRPGAPRVPRATPALLPVYKTATSLAGSCNQVTVAVGHRAYPQQTLRQRWPRLRRLLLSCWWRRSCC